MLNNLSPRKVIGHMSVMQPSPCFEAWNGFADVVLAKGTDRDTVNLLQKQIKQCNDESYGS